MSNLDIVSEILTLFSFLRLDFLELKVRKFGGRFVDFGSGFLDGRDLSFLGGLVG